MTAALFLPFYAAIDGDGVPMALAKLYFYTTGSDTPQDTYTSSALSSANANPVVADADGLFPPIYLAPGPDYKAILKTSADVTVATRDPITSPTAEDNATGSVTMQGRLSLVTSTPVMVSNQASKTVIYYTPYTGNTVGIWSGTRFAPTTFSELTNDLTASSTGKAGPAAASTSKNYDLFVWSDSGTIRLTRGPLWSSDTARGTGVGTTELERVQGVLVNAENITNGPTAGFGTYVGTVRTDGSAQANWNLGGTAASGTASSLGVWNMYNRVRVAGMISDSTNSWTYSTATVRAANASATIRAQYVIGWQEDVLSFDYFILGSIGAGNASIGLNLDSTSATYNIGRASLLTVGQALLAHADVQSAIGWHFVSACENGDGSNTATFYGDNGTTVALSGLNYVGNF